jgi:uncharacterized UBP type Zn finger protein
MASECTHRDLIGDVAPNTMGCEECMRAGHQWSQLRLCLVCGHVGCCDTSAGRHASQHFAETGHALVQMLDKPDPTYWCYVDEVTITA